MTYQEEKQPHPENLPKNRFQTALGKGPMVIMLITVLATASVVHLSWQQAFNASVADLTHQLNIKITTNIVRETKNLLENASSDLTLIHELLIGEVLDYKDIKSIETLFLSMLQSNPTLSWITLGFPNGNFFGTQRQSPKTFRSVNRLWNPKTKLAKSMNRFFQQDGGALMLTHSASNEISYFAPERAWYRDALQAGKQVWTGVYIYASSQKPGIDVAMTLKKSGAVAGVIAVGMELGQISDYLSHIAVGKTGISFIINRRGELIAYQDISEVVVTENAEKHPKLRHLSSTRAPMLRIAAEAAQQWDLPHIQTEIDTTVQTNDSKHLVTLAPSGHSDWLAGTVISAQEFMEEVHTIQNNLLFMIGMAILTLSLLTFLWTRAFLVRPLVAITLLASKVGQGKSKRRKTNSFISPIVEINLLFQAMRRMEQDLLYLREKERQDSEKRLRQEQSFALLNQKLRQADDLPSLCEVGLHFLIHALGAHIGSLYLMDENSQLHLNASYGVNPDSLTKRLPLKDSWLGTAIQEKRAKTLTNVPSSSFIIHTGVLDITPHTIIALPLFKNEKPAHGILSMGSMHPLSEEQLDFAQRIAQVITVAIFGIQSSIRTKLLLKQTTQQKEALSQGQVALNEAIEKLKKTSEYKSQFLANMSHEIRTPMNAIIGMTHLVLQTNLTDKQHDYLSKLQLSSHALLAIINDILDFSKVEAGEMNMESIEFDLDNTLDNLANMVCGKAEEKALELLFSRPSSVPNHLIGDPLRLGQILINLTNNAIKFTKKGEVFVGVEPIQKEEERVQLRFSVQDTGIGLTQEQASKLFQPFSQADTSTTRKYGGTGLGLSICKRLVEMMDGEIGVTSQPGKGSTFSFTGWFGFQRLAEEKESPLMADLRKMKTLIVDHNEHFRQVLGEMMLSLSLDCHSVHSGAVALEAMETAVNNPNTKPYQLILMTWKMPAMDGIEAVRQIKEHLLLPHPPHIILVTPYSREEVISQKDRLLFDAFISKPINPSQLRFAITSIFTKKQKSNTRRARKYAQIPDMKAMQSIMGASILVADDNKINQQITTELLKSKGLLVTTVENGREAVEAVKKGNFDAVLTDIQMPEMDGFQATEKIREDPRFKTLPILAMTAHAMPEDREKSLHAGMDDHITKPIDPDKLFAAMVKWIPVKERAKPGLSPPKTEGPSENLPKYLPGINMDIGLRHVAGNKQLLGKLLREFRQDYLNIVGIIQTNLEQGREEDVLRITHTIKGIAGSLGANDLRLTTRDLETTVKKAQSKEYEARLDQFEKALNPILRGIATLKKTPTPEKTVADLPQEYCSPEEITTLEPLFQELAIMLYAGHSSSEEKLVEIMRHMPHSKHTPTLKRLKEQVEDYEFQTALASLSKLAQSLEIPIHTGSP